MYPYKNLLQVGNAISNSYGITVYQTNQEIVNGNFTRVLDVSGLQAGVYSVTVYADYKSITRMVVKMENN